LDRNAQVSCLINQRAIDRVDTIVQADLAAGATLMCGGHRLLELGPLFYSPTVLRDVKPNMQSMRMEIFGPVAPIYKFESEDEALRIANDTEFGLAGYLFTNDLRRTFKFQALEVGMLAVNSGVLSAESAPFGGVKQSGFGREGSKLGVDDFMEVKQISIQYM